ncbi:MAG: DNA polymerase III subunit alpha [Paracoccaceae bacterium]
MSAPSFVHLRARSAYSLLEGAIHVKALPGLAAKLDMPAIGLADSGNLFGALEFAEAAAKAGVQPVMGITLDVQHAESRPGERAEAPRPLALYAKDETGWLNLMALASDAYLRSDPGVDPCVRLATLEGRAEGLICLTGGPSGALAALLAAGKTAPAEALARRLSAAFPDRLYVELQRHGAEAAHTPAEAASEPGLVDLAYALDLPLVATNEAFFADPAMFEAHDALICIGEGRYVNESDRRRLTPEHWLKPADAMVERFADLPEALENTVEIARRCAFRPKTHAPILPRFAEDEVEELRRQAKEGLAARLDAIEPAAPHTDYEARLDYELSVIEGMGFPGYFLIVADFIKWAKARAIPVGPGRGSGAGSLVAYALTITDLDPLRYGLLFERFLNPERVSMPDFDIDFCMERREEVIDYVADAYGRDRVAQIITFGALMSKAAVRDVARVLQLPFAVGDRLSKLIPMEGVKPVPIARARKEEPRFQEEADRDETVAFLLDVAERIEGLFRNASTHAAGVVIGDRPLEQLVPLYQDPKAPMPATQYNMKWVEQAGLVKFDFLGLKTLTVIQSALDLLAASGTPIDLARIPLDDPATYALYGRADTVGVFQVESAGMRDALRQLGPTCLEDIIALVALYRPGPMENIPVYCDVKNKRRARASIHPLIDGVLDETQGIIVYQEQVMEIARKMAGYSLGQADMLRRAMGKKIQAAMDAERPKFLAGAAKNGVDKEKALEVWYLLDKFANYGFNKSHAAAYGLVSYQTAWLKANHPVEFMAAVMNNDLALTDKLAAMVAETRRLGIEVAPPCVNRSGALFTVREGRIAYALGALKGVGVEAMRLVERARAAGPFADLFDVARRGELRAVGKRALEMLTRAGAFDALEPNRARVLASLESLIDYSGATLDEAASGQVSLFGGAEALPPPRLAEREPWTPIERLTEEHAAVGFYLSGHPLDAYLVALARRRVLSHKAFLDRSGEAGGAGRIMGTLGSLQIRKSAKGTRFAYLQFSDPSGGYEVMAFSDALAEAEGLLKPGANLVLAVETEGAERGGRMMLRGVQPVDEAVAADAGGLRVRVREAGALGAIARRLGCEAAGDGAPRARGPAALRPEPVRTRRATGPVSLVLALADAGQEVELTLPGRFPTGPEIVATLREVAGVETVEEA